MHTGKLPVTKTARYFINREPSDTTKYIWMVLHGYGLHAGYFLQKFQDLDPTVHTVVAPEGLNRFYQEGVMGRVGASWMTKEEREDDISDNLNYLDSLYNHIREGAPSDVKLVVLGFSQGSHTASRWLVHRKPKGAVQYITWASDLPRDVLESPQAQYLNQFNPVFFVGDDDPYIPSDRYAQLISLLDSTKLKYNVIHYEGKHRVYPNVLSEFVRKTLETHEAEQS